MTHPNRFFHAKVLAVAALTLLAPSTDAASPLALEGGLFFEAEDYTGRPWYVDEGFATKTNEALGSGGTGCHPPERES